MGLDEGGAGGLGGVQVLGGLPQVFEHVCEVDDDVDVHVASGGFSFQAFQLVVGAVDQHDPAAAVRRVGLFGLVEQHGDHGGGGVLQGGVDPAARGARWAACSWRRPQRSICLKASWQLPPERSCYLRSKLRHLRDRYGDRFACSSLSVESGVVSALARAPRETGSSSA
ncbi:hypothetical protein [Streptomyces sp. NL15-2K]|uniref:hypothetical protein n=1 Tax=Streptomyces sp. NL15-2K TaxID=376149 RepID=UPI000F56BFEE